MAYAYRLDLEKLVEHFTGNEEREMLPAPDIFTKEFFEEVFNQVFNPRTIVRMGPSGFNAKFMRDRFINKVKENPVTSKDQPLLTNPTKWYRKCQPIEDLLLFIMLFIKYGNNIQKALRKLNPLRSKIITIKCALYGITTVPATAQGLKYDQLSLSRIALAFPTHTAIMILKNKTPGILMCSTFFYQELPLVMQHTIFPGLIPVKKFTDDLREIALILNIEKSVILSRCKDIETIRETLGEMIESSAKYVDAAIDNSIDDESKLKVLKMAEIIDVNDDGEFQLAAKTVELVNKLGGIKSLYSLKYSDAVCKIYDN